MHADNILVLEDGKIVESGTNAELLERGGIYKRIYDMQMAMPDELKEELTKEQTKETKEQKGVKHAN
jgi:ABC-type transport system involved in cytochrome bd biosynthesis fused ATPase/permease subunit